MAKQQAVWGIDIGQCAVKALRCVPDSSGSGVVADAFDYIEYPKVLSQPDAEPETLIKEALEQFLSRNEVRGDKVAISVSGQAGLSRFFKPPPVDPRTLPDIVKYEAKQQIPFQLEDVIWDFQQIGGTVIDGLTVDAEIGIFAMKREAVFKALQPFADAEIEVDVIQLSPLAIYNVVLNEVLTDVPSPEEIDPNNPPESLIVLSMGTDTTDLVITDGIHLWQRNIPIGGNHFTKQLSRELKLTYAKAEHLKRNISTKTKEEGRTVLQAMKPVFNDLVTEINRSISYFQGINKKAKIGQVLVLGNAAKLVGLRQYLTKSLSSEIVKLNNYKSLGGEAVTGSKQFGENVLSYAVSYGLCLQTLGQAKLDTNLLPHEFVVERLIRAKKPWALAAVGSLFLACSLIYLMNYMAMWGVHPEKEIAGESWSSATNKADRVVQVAQGYIDDDKSKVTELEKVREIQTAVAGQSEGRNWAELYSAIYQVRPRDPRIEPGTPVDPKIIPYEGRQEIYIDSVETVYFPELEEWLEDDIKDRYISYVDQQRRAKAGKPPAPEGPKDPLLDENGNPVEDPATEDPDATAAEEQDAGALPDDLTAEEQAELEDIREAMKLEGAGWVIQIKGHHYNNAADLRSLGLNAGTYVKNTFLSQLENGRVMLPIPKEYQEQFGISKAGVTFSMQKLGIRYPVLTADPRVDLTYGIANPDHPSYRGAGGSGGSGFDPMGGGAGAGAGGPMGPMGGGAGGDAGGEEAEASDEPFTFAAPRYDFTIQFAWQPVGLFERLRMRQARQEKREEGGSGTAGGNNEVSTLD